MIYRFTDAEYAVIVDSLGAARDRLSATTATPNIDAALAKFAAMGRPEGCAFLTVTGEDAELIGGALKEREPREVRNP